MADSLRKNQGLTIIVKSRDEILFDGLAYSITSLNDLGFFDILPSHSNFVTLIKDFIVIDKDLPSEKNIKMEKGIMTVQYDKVQVYVGI